MATVFQILDLAEMYAGQSGVNKNGIDRAFMLKILNTKLAKMHEDTGWQGDDLTIMTIAGIAEYDIPNSGVPIIPDNLTKVTIDGEVASLLQFGNLETLQKRSAV